MSSWNEHYGGMNMPPNMMAMGGMMPANMMPPGAMGPPVTPMPMPPFGLLGDMPPVDPAPPVSQPASFIGPIPPSNITGDDMDLEKPETKQDSRQNNDKHDRSGGREDRHDRAYNRDRGNRRSPNRRSHDKDSNSGRGNRNDKNRNRERQSKWDNNDQTAQQGIQQMNMMMQSGPNMNSGPSMVPSVPNQPMFPGQAPMFPGQMMPFNNMMNPMINPHGMDMSNMGTMGMMPGGMGQMQNMMMMNPQMQMQNQMFFSNGMILPPIPGSSTPSRRERPPGCRTIFIGGLPNGISEDNIGEIFQRFGAIEDVKLHKQGICHVRFEKHDSVELSFMISGYRLKLQDQNENDTTAMFVDYALNRDDQNEYERGKNKRKRSPTPPKIEPYTPQTLSQVSEKIKSDTEFVEGAPTLVSWLERGECNKRNANVFYALIQASNNQLRRLFNEKMTMDDEFQNVKTTFKDKFASIVTQFEQVAKILTVAKHQRVSDHFSKQQRRNVEMWLKMTEEVVNIREEYNATFEEDDSDGPKVVKNGVPMEKYEQLKAENENLIFELEGYKNEAHLAKDEAERKFEKFKAHFIASQALQNKQGNQQYQPLLAPPMTIKQENSQPPLPLSDPSVPVPPSEAKLISIIATFLMVHPLGASLDYIVSYVKSLVPNAAQSSVLEVLKKYTEVFKRKTSGVGANMEQKWGIAMFDLIERKF